MGRQVSRNRCRDEQRDEQKVMPMKGDRATGVSCCYVEVPKTLCSPSTARS